jgi:hypothetical protein
MGRTLFGKLKADVLTILYQGQSHIQGKFQPVGAEDDVASNRQEDDQQDQATTAATARSATPKTEIILQPIK